jgi:hypothetical protein
MNDWGYTPESTAKVQGHHEIVSPFQQHGK